MATELKAHRVHRLLNPRSIALVGASADSAIIRGRLLRTIVDGGYRGELYPVTRSHEHISGMRCYARVDDIPATPELAIITVPAPVVPELLEACGRKGVAGAIIISSGFEEQGDEQASARQRQVREIAEQYGMIVSGPNAEGFFNPSCSLAASFSPTLRGRPASQPPSTPGVGIVSQSGGMGFAIFSRGEKIGMPVSAVVTTGNEVDVEAIEIADYLLSDPHTNVIAMFIEGLKRPSELADMTAHAANAAKPLVVAKVGRSEAGRRATLSHTASLTGSDRVYRSVLSSQGVTLVDDLDALVDVSHAFARFRGRPARGKRIAVLTASGGGGIWMADVCVDAGLVVEPLDADTRDALIALMPAYGSAHNPVDITAQGIVEFGFSTPLEVLLASPSVDAVTVVCSAVAPKVLKADAEQLRRVGEASDKPVMFCAYTTLHPDAVSAVTGAGFPVTGSLPNTAAALLAWAEYSSFLSHLSSSFPPIIPPLKDVAAALSDSPNVLCEYRARHILACSGLTLDVSYLATSEDAVRAAVPALSGRVALKIQSPALPHKTDVDGVALDIDDPEQAVIAYQQIMEAAKRHAPAASVDGVLVTPMAKPGLEMIVGSRCDENFGPMLMVGFGGVLVEALDDIALRPAPVDKAAAVSMLKSLRGATLLDGRSGRTDFDVDALVDVLVHVSQLAARYCDVIREIDLNPVVVHDRARGLTIIDALIIKHH